MRRGLHYTLKHLYARPRICTYSPNIALLNFNITTYESDLFLHMGASIKYKINNRCILVIVSETWKSLPNLSYTYLHPTVTIVYTWEDLGNNKTSYVIVRSEFVKENNIDYCRERKVSFTI